MDERLLTPFVNSTRSVIKDMSGIETIQSGAPTPNSGDFISYGVSSIIAFSGKIKGRFMIDLPAELAIEMVSNLTGESWEHPRDRLFLAAISELNNIIAGDANTFLNNQYKLGLRLAPPIVFTGNHISVATSKMKSSTIEFATDTAAFKINVGFQGGLD